MDQNLFISCNLLDGIMEWFFKDSFVMPDILLIFPKKGIKKKGTTYIENVCMKNSGTL